jgi:VWFA-related protein
VNRLVNLISGPISRRGLLVSAASLFAGWKLRGQQQDPNFSAGVKVVNVFATVRNGKGEVVRDLTKADFTLEEDGRPQPIAYFSQENNLPLTLGLLVDTSGSQRRVLDQEIAASRSFFEKVLREDKDQAFVIHFDREVELLEDLTSSRKRLESSLDSLDKPQLRRPDGGGGYPRGGGYPGGPRGQRFGGTMLYDAVFLACDEEMRKQSGRKAVVLLSDGVDTGSKTTLVSAIESAQRADTIVYSVLFADPQAYGGFQPGFGGLGGYGGRRRGGATRMPPQAARPDGKKILERISKETGGALFEVSSKHPLDEIYDRIEEVLRNQYSLGYTPDRAEGAGYRKIRLTAKQKGLVVQARDGYYADR